MELHNLFFSIWYHHMLYSGKNQIPAFGFQRILDIPTFFYRHFDLFDLFFYFEVL
jgi:hypothetical protein